jgi:hypothetical protein
LRIRCKVLCGKWFRTYGRRPNCHLNVDFGVIWRFMKLAFMEKISLIIRTPRYTGAVDNLGSGTGVVKIGLRA